MAGNERVWIPKKRWQKFSLFCTKLNPIHVSLECCSNFTVNPGQKRLVVVDTMFKNAIGSECVRYTLYSSCGTCLPCNSLLVDNRFGLKVRHFKIHSTRCFASILSIITKYQSDFDGFILSIL